MNKISLYFGFCLALGSLSAEKEDIPFLSGDVTLAADYFRSLPEGSWEGNTGAFLSVNLGKALPEHELCVQAGASYGLYDWAGRGSTVSVSSTAIQQQTFITIGVAKKPFSREGISFAAVYDWMVNRNFGVFGVNPTLAQARALLSYTWHGQDEWGLWGAVNTQTAHETSAQLPLKFRAVSQGSAFWRHSFSNGASSLLWAGIPFKRGLMFRSGSPGLYILGLRFRAPLNAALSLEGHGAYMGGRKFSGGGSERTYAANLCFGLTYAFGKKESSQSPLMPVADNSTFLVDTNLSQ